MLDEVLKWLPLAVVLFQAGVTVQQLRRSRDDIKEVKGEVRDLARSLKKEYVSKEVWEMSETSKKDRYDQLAQQVGEVDRHLRIVQQQVAHE